MDMACGRLPQEIWDAIDDPGIIKAAWNAQFKRTCIGHYLGRVLSDSWQCSMIHAASLSLPLALEECGIGVKDRGAEGPGWGELNQIFFCPVQADKIKWRAHTKPPGT